MRRFHCVPSLIAVAIATTILYLGSCDNHNILGPRTSSEKDLINVPTRDEEVEGGVPVIPVGYSLAQNYPNPFNSVTSIGFALPEALNIKLEVLNVSGQVVDVMVDAELEAGYYTIRWNGRSFGSGVYFCRLQAGGFIATKKMIRTNGRL